MGVGRVEVVPDLVRKLTNRESMEKNDDLNQS
jgi:hypothetical protein